MITTTALVASLIMTVIGWGIAGWQFAKIERLNREAAELNKTVNGLEVLSGEILGILRSSVSEEEIHQILFRRSLKISLTQLLANTPLDQTEAAPLVGEEAVPLVEEESGLPPLQATVKMAGPAKAPGRDTNRDSGVDPELVRWNKETQGRPEASA